MKFEKPAYVNNKLRTKLKLRAVYAFRQDDDESRLYLDVSQAVARKDVPKMVLYRLFYATNKPVITRAEAGDVRATATVANLVYMDGLYWNNFPGPMTISPGPNAYCSVKWLAVPVQHSVPVGGTLEGALNFSRSAQHLRFHAPVLEGTRNGASVQEGEIAGKWGCGLQGRRTPYIMHDPAQISPSVPIQFLVRKQSANAPK